MSRLRKKEQGGGGSPSWMATMADMMQLLLTFFILLFSMSSVDQIKFASVATSVQEAFIGYGGKSMIIEGYQGENINQVRDGVIMDDSSVLEEIPQEVVQMYEKVGAFLEENNFQADLAVSMNSSGVYVDIKDAILFDSGSAQLKDSGLEVLRNLKGLIQDFNNDIVIEGHTDNVKSIMPQYPTNWELSTARAVSVVRYLVEVEGVNPSRLSARGYGEYSPIADNDTAENRALNRRVNMFIVFDKEGVN